MSKSENTSGKLSKLRDLVKDCYFDDDYFKSDGYLLRWLQYMNFDVKKSDVAFRKRLEWRKEHKMDSILEEDFSELESRFPLDISEVDKNGRLIVKVLIQTYDCKNFHFDRKKEYYIRFAFLLNERIEQRIKEQYLKTNATASQFVGVIDCSKMSDCMKDIGWKNLYLMVMIVKEIVSHLAPNFPRGAEITYVLNASKLFTFFYSAVKPFTCKETLEVLQIYGTDNKFDWRSQHF